MSTHQFARFERDAALYAVVPANLRVWSNVAATDTTITFTYTPDLSAAETATLTLLVGYCRLGPPGITPAEWVALGPSLDTMRTFQQLSQADFIALTQNQRDRMLFDLGNAHTRVLRALMRD